VRVDDTPVMCACPWCKVGETALHTAGIKGDPDVVKALLDAGADANARTHGGTYLKMTPTHWMAYGKQYRAVVEMIEAGALQLQTG